MRRLGASLFATAALTLAPACDEPPPPAPTPATSPTPPPVVAAPEPPALAAFAASSTGEAAVATPPEYATQTWRAYFGRDAERGLVVLAKDESETAPKVRLVLFGAPAAGAYPVVTEAERGSRTQVVTVALDHQPTLRVLGGEVSVSTVTESELAGTVDLEVRDAMAPSQASRIRASFRAAHDRFYDAQLDHERAIREQLRRR